jgi:hypothetical protein
VEYWIFHANSAPEVLPRLIVLYKHFLSSFSPQCDSRITDDLNYPSTIDVGRLTAWNKGPIFLLACVVLLLINSDYSPLTFIPSFLAPDALHTITKKDPCRFFLHFRHPGSNSNNDVSPGVCCHENLALSSQFKTWYTNKHVVGGQLKLFHR